MAKAILWISNKLQLNQKGNHANYAGVVIAVLGVTLSLAIMLCTVSVVLGFKSQITRRILGFDGEVCVMPAYDYSTGTSAQHLALDSALTSAISQTIPGSQVSLRFRQPGILKTDTDFAGIYAVGYDKGHNFDFERSSLIQGQYPTDGSYEIAISKALASSMGLECGETVNAYFVVDNGVKTRKLTISGIYSTGFSDYDQTVVYAPLSALQKIAGADSMSATQIDIAVGDIDQIALAAEQLQYRLLDDYNSGAMSQLYPVDNVKHTGAAFFSWLDLLDTNVVVIFILMACVAGFTLISSMFIIILNRISTIGILRAFGTSKHQIRLIFVNISMKIVGIGVIIGNILGLGLICLQHYTGFLKLDPEMYYLDQVPTDLCWGYFAIVNGAVILVAWLMLWLPSRAAATISPASTMRYE